MSEKSNIGWTDSTLNPVVGCTKVSAACKNCFAIRDAWRMAHNSKFGVVYPDSSVPMEKRNPYGPLVKKTGAGTNWTGELHFFEDRLEKILKWRKPRRIFINSLSDLFHSSMQVEHNDKIFSAMALRPDHIYQILTKRPDSMKDYAERVACSKPGESTYEAIFGRANAKHGGTAAWPLRSVHLGITIENEEAAEERVPFLRATPAAVRWISYEPALGDIDWERWLPGMDWIVCGGESSSGSRPMELEWARHARDACAKAGVPLFLKQWGDWAPDTNGKMVRVGRKKAGRILDGRTHDDFPKE